MMTTQNSSSETDVCGISDGCYNTSNYKSNKLTATEARINQAKTICQQKGVRFTQLRQQVYELILLSEQPMGAYDLLREMQLTNAKQTTPKNIAPPTVYRSIDFLLQHGFIHQLTSINAFIPCCHPREKHTVAFLICDECHGVQEYHHNIVKNLLTNTQKDTGFKINNSIIEVNGICSACIPQ